MNQIEYKVGLIPSVEDIVRVYDSSGLNRPTKDANRIQQMFASSNLIVSAWAGEELVGLSRSLTDFCYVCYLSDLAVSKDYQKSGIGKELVEQTTKEIVEKTTLILVAAPDAVNYYPKIGFDDLKNVFVINRKR